jgi:hypothetical protein
MSVSKRPKNRRPCQTGNDNRVFINVEIVVVIDEIMPQRLPEDGPGDTRQGDANCHHPPAGEARCLFHTRSSHTLKIPLIHQKAIYRAARWFRGKWKRGLPRAGKRFFDRATWLVLATTSIRRREGASGSPGAASVPRAGHQTIGRTNPQRARRNRKAVARQPKP